MMDERFNGDRLILSKDYARTMDEVVLPWLAVRRTDTTVTGDGGKPLFCSRFDADNPSGTVLIVHGFTECADKFAELIHSLLKNGYSVVAYDQRGHGRSWRDPEITDTSLTHVDRFEEYVKDLRCVCEQVLAEMPRPWLLLAHSMGGAVSSLFLERYPGVFSRAALCAPMIAPDLRGLPAAAVLALCAAERLAGRDKARIFASKPFDGPEDFAQSCATGRERFDWYDALRVRNPLFQNNGPTYGWTRESANVTRAILAPGAVERIDIPVCVYAAEVDNSVQPEPQRRFAARLRDGSIERVPGSRHEIYRSGDDVLFPWWHGVLAFFAGGEQET